MKPLRKIGTEWSQFSHEEEESSNRLLEIFHDLLPFFGHDWNVISTLFLRRQSVSRILYYNELYKKIVSVPGVICEFGVQWGSGLSQLMAFRGIHEPYNHTRKIYGFDTFSGFPTIDAKDGGYSEVGDYSVNSNHFNLLEEILTIQESFSPLSHIKKFDLIKGDVSHTVEPWLSENPHVIIAMAIFDMDIYKPTKDALQKILPRLTKGSILVFDELNEAVFPGEMRALDEVLGINNLQLKRDPNQPGCAWTVFGE